MGDDAVQGSREDVETLRDLDTVRMGLPNEDFDRFLEMLERSDPQAFRELVERNTDWAR